MRATFVHTADNHLGYEQYGVKERFNDFARAFLSVVEAAIERQADLFVVAGDLFNKRAIDAMTLIQAQTALNRLKEAGIPAVAIEGNHDRSYYRDGISWLQFLGWQGSLCLLNPRVESGIPQLAPWDSHDLRGSYVDLKGGALRVYGLPWYGASTVRMIEAFANELRQASERERAEGVQYRLLLMHTGVEGMVPNMSGLPTRAQFEPLRGLIDYLALGHVHKPYSLEDWLYNPGSTETWGAEESQWERGYYVVAVDTDVEEGQLRHRAEHVVNPRRPFIRLPFKVDGLDTPTALYEHFERYCQMRVREEAAQLALGPDMDPVVDVGLTGTLAFDGGAIDRAVLEECARRYFHPLVVRVNDFTRDIDYDLGEDELGDGRDRADRLAVELKVFQELIARDVRFAPHAPQWAHVLANVKQMALGGEEPAEIVRHLRESRALLG